MPVLSSSVNSIHCASFISSFYTPVTVLNDLQIPCCLIVTAPVGWLLMIVPILWMGKWSAQGHQLAGMELGSSGRPALSLGHTHSTRGFTSSLAHPGPRRAPPAEQARMRYHLTCLLRITGEMVFPGGGEKTSADTMS